MRIIPSSFPETSKSAAEKRVFNSLKQLPWDNWICFHSLRLSRHQYKTEGELDFVLLGPKGLFVLEIKGGKVSREEGMWNFEDRYGEPHRRAHSPFEQASSGMYALMKLIKERFPGERMAQANHGYGVIFPDCEFDIKTVEWSPETVLDATVYGTDASLGRFLTRLIAHWEGRWSALHPLSVRDVEQLAAYLRPRFDKAVTLAHQAGEVDREMASLTDEQYERLDGIDSNRRIICTGGAGTGKTFLAMEVARRHAEQDMAVLVVCRSPVLVAYLREKGDHRLSIAHPGELANAPGEHYDVVVLDEGQDLLNFRTLPLLDKKLRGGLAGGCWRVFMDANNQSGIYGEFEQDALELLRSYGATELRLRHNCRNTLNIVSQTRLLTGADIGTSAAGAGPDVVFEFAADLRQGTRLLEQHLNRLLRDDVPPGDITILSPRPLSGSIVATLPESLKTRVLGLTAFNAARFPAGHIMYASIADFKGLENRFVIVVDLDPVHLDQADMSAVYVAMSRARAGLTLIFPSGTKEAISALTQKNLPLLLSSRTHGSTSTRIF